MVFNLLVHFTSNPDRVFTRDDLIESIWNSRIVSDATVSGCIKNARKALGDSGDTQRHIKNQPSR